MMFEGRKTGWLPILIIFITVLIASRCARGPSRPALFFGTEELSWVNRTLSRMTIEEKIGQMISCAYLGYFVSSDSDYLKDLKTLIVRYKIGGLIIYGGNVYETAYFTNTLQRTARIPLLIASDLERGTGNQISGATQFPPLMSVGAADSEELAYAMGRITAEEGRAIGIHMTYAPVVDVNINPDNPIINTRAIGEDPEQVSRLTMAFIRGCQENGMIATAKHFPGHGDTNQDSHLLLPVIQQNRERLDKIELYPFKRAVEAGVQAIMTAHLYVPALDPTPNLPATLSPVIMTGLLRREMKFRGIIVSDAMTMGGITRYYAAPDAALKAVEAGVDIIILPPQPEDVISSLIEAVRSGKIPEARIDESVRRILNAKARLGLHKRKRVNVESLADRIATKENLGQAALAFESSATLVKNETAVLPLSQSDKRIAVFSLSSDPGDYFAGRDFCNSVKKRCPRTQIFYADADTGQERLDNAGKLASGAETIVFALFSSLRAEKGNVGLDVKHVRLIRKFAEGDVPVIVISFGSPYFLRDFPEVDAYLCLYRNTPQTQEIAARVIFGEMETKGKLPVSLPGLYPLGHGLKLK
ncbi:MAG: glycoside hydrolase family 3 N-terminal domain-containing protein [Candidatus Aminicenantales bacterium]